MSATQAATSAAVGGSERQVPLVQPHRADVHRVRRRGRRGQGRAEDQLGRAAADVDDQHRRRGRVPQVAHRAVEGERGLLVARQDLGLDAEPGPDARDEDVGVRRRRGSPRSRRTGSGWRRARGSARRTRRARRTSAPAPRRRSRPVAVDALAEPDHPHLADRDLGQLADQQLDRVGAAVDRARRCSERSPPTSTHGPAAHQSPSRSSTSSPSGFTPRPWASDCAGEHVQALDPVRHPAGRDALDLRARCPARPRAAR